MTPWAVACQASLSRAFPRQEYWSGWPFPSPGDLPDPGMEHGSLALQADSLPPEPSGICKFVILPSPVLFILLYAFHRICHQPAYYMFTCNLSLQALLSPSRIKDFFSFLQNPQLLAHSGGGLVTKLCPTLAIPWTVACQAPLSKEFSRWEYWSGLPFFPPRDLPDPGLESTALQSDSLPAGPPGKPWLSEVSVNVKNISFSWFYVFIIFKILMALY